MHWLFIALLACNGRHMNDIEQELLQRSADANNWGFALNLLGAPNQSVINVDLPAWMARAWTLNLLRYRYGSGVLVTTAGASTNPDAQTFGDDVYVTLDYGVGGVSERVVFDYPRTGGTVEFHAASIRVYVSGPSNVVFLPGGNPPLSPLVGGFVTPYARGDAHDSVGPTFTTPSITIANNNTVQTNVPPRARAYRLVPVPSGHTLETTARWLVTQQTGFGANIAIDFGQTETVGEPFPITQGTDHEYMNRNVWIPLIRDTEQIAITYQQAAQAGTVRIQFLLDLG